MTFWKIGHLLRAALLKAQVKYRKRYGHARTRVSSPTISSESPVETIDSSSSKSIETEPVSSVLSGSVESATIMADPDSSESNDLDNGTVKQDGKFFGSISTVIFDVIKSFFPTDEFKPPNTC